MPQYLLISVKFCDYLGVLLGTFFDTVSDIAEFARMVGHFIISLSFFYHHKDSSLMKRRTVTPRNNIEIRPYLIPFRSLGGFKNHE